MNSAASRSVASVRSVPTWRRRAGIGVSNSSVKSCCGRGIKACGEAIEKWGQPWKQ